MCSTIIGRLRLYEQAEHKGKLRLVSFKQWVTCRATAADPWFFTDLIYEGDITDNCTNLSPGSDVNASSVNSDGVCVDLYDQMNCTGQRLKLEPTDHSHNDLTTHEFDNTISSYTSCKELPIRSNIMPSMPSSHEASIVTLSKSFSLLNLENHCRLLYTLLVIVFSPSEPVLFLDPHGHGHPSDIHCTLCRWTHNFVQKVSPCWCKFQDFDNPSSFRS